MQKQKNELTLSHRIFNGLAALFLIIYGCYSVSINSLFIPGRRGREGLIITGTPVYIIFAAMLCASLNLFAQILRHYDPQNAHLYIRVSQFTKYLGWGLFIIALLTYVFS